LLMLVGVIVGKRHHNPQFLHGPCLRALDLTSISGLRE
jgi:hypothetical protein